MKHKVRTTFTLTKSAWKAWEWIADKYDIEENNVLNPFIRDESWYYKIEAAIKRPCIDLSSEKLRRSKRMSEDIVEGLSEIGTEHSVSISLVLETYIHQIKSSVLELERVQAGLNKLSIESFENTSDTLGHILDLLEDTKEIYEFVPIEEIREVSDELESISIKLNFKKLIGLSSLYED